MRFLTQLLIGLILWPLEAFAVMIALHLLEARDFDVPAAGYWSSFWIATALSLLYGAASLSSKVTDDL